MNKISINEIFRKIIHIIFSAIPLSYLWFIEKKETMLVILLIMSSLALFVEFLRRKMNFFSNLFNYLFGFMLRNYEFSEKLTGATWLLIGWVITVAFFEMPIAISAMLFLSIGDSIAAVAGKIYPKFSVGQKTLSGAFFGFISSFIVVMVINQTLSPIVILFGAVIAMLIELIPTKFNDNLTIPIFSGFAMMLLDKTI